MTYTQTDKNLIKKPHTTSFCSVSASQDLQKNHNFLNFEGLNKKKCSI